MEDDNQPKEEDKVDKAKKKFILIRILIKIKKLFFTYVKVTR